MILPSFHLINGDCLEHMKNLDDCSVDMILCDLPYGVTRNKWDSVLPLDALWNEYKRIIKENGAICLHADGLFMAMLMLSEPRLWRYNLVWDKVLPTGFLNANRMPLRRTEEICVFYKKQPIYNPQKTVGSKNHSKGNATGLAMEEAGLGNHNYGAYTVVDNSEKHGCLKHPTSLITFQKPHPSKAVHPTEKPVALLEWLIQTYTQEGALVLDNCMGSGSTGVACVNTRRRFIGMEMDVGYYDMAIKRINEAATTQKERMKKNETL